MMSLLDNSVYAHRQPVLVDLYIDEVKRIIDILAPGGGFIFDTNAVVKNVKRENLEAMFETIRAYGKA